MEKEIVKPKYSILEILYQVTILIFAIVPVYFIFKTTPKDITNQALIIFGIMVGILVIAIIFSFIYSKYKQMCNDIKCNKDDMESIKKDMAFKEIFNKLDNRLIVVEKMVGTIFSSVFERKRKRGQIDPRIIIWILLLLLLFLFLRSIGVFK